MQWNDLTSQKLQVDEKKEKEATKSMADGTSTIILDIDTEVMNLRVPAKHIYQSLLRFHPETLMTDDFL